MQIDTTSIVGIAASIGTSTYLIPQIIKLVKEKKAEDISIPMFLVALTGLVLWITYGILKKDWIIIISNILSVLLNITVTTMSLIYKQKKQ